MSEIGERARKIIDKSLHRNIKQYALNAGIKVPTLTAMVNRGVEPRFTLLESILKASPDVSAEWLMRGEGPMYKSEAKKEVSDSNYTEGDNAQQHYTKTVVDSDTTQRVIAVLQQEFRDKNELIMYLLRRTNNGNKFNADDQLTVK